MKRVLPFLVLLVLAVCFMPNFSHAEDGVIGNINFLIGQKFLDEDDWAPYDGQMEYGLDLDIGGATWPVHFDAAYLMSSDDQEIYGYDPDLGDITANAEATTTELRLGLKYFICKCCMPTIRPYIAAGVARITGEVEVDAYGVTDSMDDSAVGFYVTGGLYWTIAEHFNLGAEIGYSNANVEIADYEVQAGGMHLLGLIGYHF